MKYEVKESNVSSHVDKKDQYGLSPFILADAFTLEKSESQLGFHFSGYPDH